MASPGGPQKVESAYRARLRGRGTDMSEHEIEQRRSASREMSRIDVETSMQRAADRIKFQQEIGVAGNRSIMLANGGAIVALLTFIGNSDAVYQAYDLKTAFICFGLGITSALLSFIASYVGQEWLSNFDTTNAWNHQLDYLGQKRTHDPTKERNMGWGLMVAASTFSLSGVSAFAIGAWFALNGIL